MKSTCYACGLLFHMGLPELEELSLDQLMAVTDQTTPEIHHDLLFGTKFEGMSARNFCAFCLTVIRDFPLAMENKNDVPGHHMLFAEERDVMPLGMEGPHHWIQCECGHRYYPPVRMNHPMASVIKNRAMNLHIIDVLYADADTTEITSLINLEA